MPQTGNDADIGREGACTLEMGGIAGGCDDAGGGLWGDAIDAGDELAEDMAVEQVLDVVLGLRQAAAPEVEVLANVLPLERVGGAVVLANGAPGSIDEGLRQFGANEVAAVVAQLGDTARCGPGDGMRGRVFGEQEGEQAGVCTAEGKSAKVAAA